MILRKISHGLPSLNLTDFDCIALANTLLASAIQVEIM